MFGGPSCPWESSDEEEIEGKDEQERWEAQARTTGNSEKELASNKDEPVPKSCLRKDH